MGYVNRIDNNAKKNWLIAIITTKNNKFSGFLSADSKQLLQNKISKLNNKYKPTGRIIHKSVYVTNRAYISNREKFELPDHRKYKIY